MLLVYTIRAIFVYDISFNSSCNSNGTPCRVALNRMQQEWFHCQLSPCSQKNTPAMASSFINFCSWAESMLFHKRKKLCQSSPWWDMFSASNNAIFALLIPQWVSLKYLVFVSIFPLFDLSRSFTISCCLTCEQQARRMSILQKYSKQKIVGQRVLRPFSIHNVKWLCMFKTTEQVFPYMLKKLITWQKQELTMWLLQAYVQWGKNILLEASHLILLP